jgi:hypothetical protein
MVQSETLEQKIDELLRSLGGLDRLRELTRLSSLDHLVNLHLLSHLTKLDKIEGLDKLKDLDQLKGLERLNDLKVMEKLDQLVQLNELRNLEQLTQLEKLSELQELRSLQDLKQLEALSHLDKLSELRRLDALGSLQDLGGLERLDHLKYLANLDRLNELTALTKLDGLNGLGELLEKHGDKFAKLRHLESLDNLHLLDQLKNLDKLDRLDELSRLDELKTIGQLAEAPPVLPAQPVMATVPVALEARSTLKDHVISFGLDLVRTIVVAAILILVLLMPQGRKVTEEAAAFLGFGQGHQVNWALQILSQSSAENFPEYWVGFQKRLEAESALVFETRAPWSLRQRYEKLHSVLSYDFNYQGQSLRERVRQDVEQRLSKFETDWKERLGLEIGQVMLRQGENQKLILWNQLKDLAVGGRWYDVIEIAASASNDRFAQEAAIVALVHLQLSDPSKLAEIMENSP